MRNIQVNPTLPGSAMKTQSTFYSSSPSAETIFIPSQEILIQCQGYVLSHGRWGAPTRIILTRTHFADILLERITKLKLYSKCEAADHQMLKVATPETTLLCMLPRQACGQLASLIFWRKMGQILDYAEPEEPFINCCEGQTYKKSEIIGQWVERHLLITAKEGLMSFRNRNEAPTMAIPATNELWTRFELVEEGKYVVLKVWNSIFKEEIGVPVHRAAKWFRAFYSLLK